MKKMRIPVRLRRCVIVCCMMATTVPLFAQYKLACSCLPPPSPQDEFGASKEVFSGRVLSIGADTTRSILMLKVTFQTLQIWKGLPSSQISIFTAMSTASCGFPFHVDSTYLVYALPYFDTLYTHLCSRTRLLSEATTDLAFLITVAVGQERTGAATFELQQNYPNPFNPRTVIRYSVASRAMVSVKVFNLLGCEVASLVNEQKEAGTYQTTWNATVPSGMYFYRLQAGDGSAGSPHGFVETRKMILLR
jgi:hypothetical protein